MGEKRIRRVTFIPPLAEMQAGVKKKRKVAAYARVSTASEEQEGSLVAQREYYEKYIHGNTSWEYVDIYYDEYNRKTIQFYGVSAPHKHKKRLSRVVISLREPPFCVYSVFAFAKGVRSSVYPLCL